MLVILSGQGEYKCVQCEGMPAPVARSTPEKTESDARSTPESGEDTGNVWHLIIYCLLFIFDYI